MSLKIKDFKYILHDLVSKINIKFEKNIFIERRGKIFVESIVSKTYLKLLRLHMPRFFLYPTTSDYLYDIVISILKATNMTILVVLRILL